MIKVGVIGIGLIAANAYLPIYACMDDVDFYFCTRNENTLDEIRSKYRWNHLFTSIDDLLKQGIQAAFVHAATPAHPTIIERLIHEGIAVYTDKPLTDHFESAVYLTKLAEEKHVMLTTGFNRRFAPLLTEASLLPDKTMIICQKNRVDASGDLRTIVYDDFIHVLDTVRFIIGKPIDPISVHFSWNSENQCSGILALFRSGHILVSGIMNRVSGANEETTQVMTRHGECVVHNLMEREWIEGTARQLKRFDDWTSTLHKRGFEPIISAFIQAVKMGQSEPIDKRDALETYRLCEWVTNQGEIELINRRSN
ncbi:Gfo/Idh/MocA family protein [Sporolactobacillus nakayamae]|uniref:Virulence factor n=1 Tax=Sporolactobacillus nakayamae TaxID=269670 RepID=A0A1I2N5Z3_9BACL|nr:Gfo/Idh/MocA family oxidoreductase [Sporolactobacillus nakayamae]SFF99033.1 virulence factor [Sporolactobacillus nakayamae]